MAYVEAEALIGIPPPQNDRRDFEHDVGGADRCALGIVGGVIAQT